MKDIIRKILKEDSTDKYVNYVINDIKERKIFSTQDAIRRYGINDSLLKLLQKKSIDKLRDLKELKINTDDTYDGQYGTYSFEFIITNVNYWETQIIGIYIEFANEGHLEVDGEDYTIKEGIYHEDFGWEVEHEVKDVIRTVLITMIPELIFFEDIEIVDMYFYA